MKKTIKSSYKDDLKKEKEELSCLSSLIKKLYMPILFFKKLVMKNTLIFGLDDDLLENPNYLSLSFSWVLSNSNSKFELSRLLN